VLRNAQITGDIASTDMSLADPILISQYSLHASGSISSVHTNTMPQVNATSTVFQIMPKWPYLYNISIKTVKGRQSKCLTASYI